MNETQEYAAYAHHLQVEHHRLQNAIGCIQREWPVISAEALSSERTARTTDALVQLRKELANHFREEEEGGCLEEAVCCCPSLGHEADVIKREHAPLLAQLDEIVTRLQAVQQDAQPPTELRQSFERFVQVLHAHEGAENMLLENAFGIPVD